MSRISQSIRAVVASVVLALFALMFCSRAIAQLQETFFVGGKSVPFSTYQAHKLISESVDLMRTNRVSDAAAKLRRALQFDPSAAEAHGMLGMALARMGKTEEAAEQMRMAVVDLRSLDSSERPRVVPALLNLSAVYQSAGKSSDALEIYRKVINEFPDAKIVPALQERVALLDRELTRQKRAHFEHKKELADDSNYYGNVIEQGRRRWPAASMPIRVYAYSGSGLTHFNPQYENILRESFDEWQRASKGAVQFKWVSSPRDADITCKWIDDPKLLESSAEGGEAQVYNLFESVVQSRILLSLQENGSAFPLTPNLVRVLCLHEIGHSLGLMGHSTRADDVLYCSTPIVDREQHLSKRDIATLNVLYSQDVDGPSNFLAQIDRDTHGNALAVMRLVIVVSALLILTCAVLLIIALKRKPKKNRGRRALG